MRFLFVLLIAALFLCQTSFARQADQDVLEAFEAGFESVEDFEKVYNFVLPSTKESKWREVPWIPGLWDGMQAAKKANKPMFIWAMNGDPLGCV